MKEGSINQKLAIFLGMLFALYAAFFLGDLWFDLVSAKLFMKITTTFGVVGVLPITFYLLWQEFIGERKMRDDKYTN